MTGWNMPPGLSDAEFDKYHQEAPEVSKEEALFWAMSYQEDFVWSVADNIREMFDDLFDNKSAMSEEDLRLTVEIIDWYWKRRGDAIISDYNERKQ